MRVLAVGCHPDDLEINAFGTLARCVMRGDDVVVCGVTNGSGGSMTLGPEEIARIRVEEARRAAAVIGAREYVNLGVNDLMVDSRDSALIEKMVDLIRMVKPDMIITQHPEDYMRDHMEVSRLVFDASFRATVPNFKTQYPCHHVIAPLFYMEPDSSGAGFTPTDYVDITDVIEKKLEALSCHDSQVGWLLQHTGEDVLATTRATSAYRGKLCLAEYAEAFLRCNHSTRMTTWRLLPEGR